jgi:hypothetical protein
MFQFFISSKISLFTTDPTHYEKTVLNQVIMSTTWFLVLCFRGTLAGKYYIYQP